MIFHPGDILKFTYQHQSVDDQTGDKHKEVLVLHPNWKNKLQAIDLKRLSPAERKVLEFVLDPKTKNTPSRIPLVNNIRKRMDPIEEIQNPQAFYAKFVKPFLRGKDAYRQYVPKLMSGVVRVRDGRISTGKPRVEKPLFGEPPQPLAKKEPAEPLTPIDVMKQQAQQKQAVQQARRLSPQRAQDILKRFGLK